MEHDMKDRKPTTAPDAATGQVATDAAEVYHSFFVPALFAQFTEPVLDHGGVEEGDRVLDVGCGTGVLASDARRRVGPDGQVVGLDPNPGMLGVARRLDPAVEWHEGAAERIPFPDDSFDRVCSQFVAMFFQDRETAVDEMARVARPGGSVTIATWSGLDRTPGYAAMVSLIDAELGDAAADALRAPFVLGRLDQLRDLLAPIGGDLRVDEVDGTAHFASIPDWVHTDVRGWTLSDMVDDEAEATLVARAERDLARFTSGDGSVQFPAPAIFATVRLDR